MGCRGVNVTGQKRKERIAFLQPIGVRGRLTWQIWESSFAASEGGAGEGRALGSRRSTGAKGATGDRVTEKSGRHCV